MAYTDSIIRPASEARDFILGSIDWASRFGNQLNENFVAQQEIPERLSRTRLNDAENRFSLQGRLQNWDSDLERRRLESELGVRTGRFALDDFDSARAAEIEERELGLQRRRLELEILDDKRAADRIANQVRKLEQETELEARTYDRLRDQIISRIPNYAMMTPVERYQEEIRVANSLGDPAAKEAVIARINKSYVDEHSSAFEDINLYTNLKEELDSLEGLTDQNSVARATQLRRNLELLRLFIPREVVEAAARGRIISYNTAGDLLMEPETVGQGTQSPLEQEIINAPLVDSSDRNNQAPIQTTQEQVNQPVPEPTPVPQEPVVQQPEPQQTAAQVVEALPDFPDYLRGALDFTEYNIANFDFERRRLIEVGNFIRQHNVDPSVRAQVAEKIRSFLDLSRENGWIN